MKRVALAFSFGLALGVASNAYAVSPFVFSTDSFIKKIEAMLQVEPGTIKIVPQIGSTFEYLGAKALPGHVYAVYIKKLSGE
jgi:hypothetical protein